MKAELIDHMGDDLRVANAARVSFDKETFWSSDWDKSLKDSDTKLIKYLATHNHWTPFSHPQITLRETVPIFVARQRFKHTIGFTYNEISRRYVDSPPEFHTPKELRGKAENKKQGSSGVITNPSLRIHILNYYNDSLNLYDYLLKEGVCPEQARMVLPQSTLTSYYVTGSLAAFARAYNLRSKEDAQEEIQELAKEWNRLISPLFPVSWKALTDG
jgi:thymidylate synthase (FAD)